MLGIPGLQRQLMDFAPGQIVLSGQLSTVFVFWLYVADAVQVAAVQGTVIWVAAFGIGLLLLELGWVGLGWRIGPGGFDADWAVTGLNRLDGAV